MTKGIKEDCVSKMQQRPLGSTEEKSWKCMCERKDVDTRGVGDANSGDLEIFLEVLSCRKKVMF